MSGEVIFRDVLAHNRVTESQDTCGRQHEGQANRGEDIDGQTVSAVNLETGLWGGPGDRWVHTGLLGALCGKTVTQGEEVGGTM